MENLIISLKVVLPLFIFITLGAILKKVRLLDDNSVSKMNGIIFMVFFPVLLFNNIHSSRFDNIFNTKLLLFCIIGVIVLMFLALFIIHFLEKDNRKKSVLVQSIFRSNLLLFGLPIISAMYGEESLGSASIVVALTVPLFNFLAVILLESYRGGRINALRVIKQIIKNPLIIGALLGILALLVKLKLPNFIQAPLNSLSSVATPLALIMLGASLAVKNIKSHAKQIIIGTSGKLIIAPLIFIPIAIALGFRGVELLTVLGVFAVPTAVSSYTMALQMDADGDLAAELIVFGSALSIITLFLWVLVLTSLGVL